MIAAQRKLKALLNEESSVEETLTTLTGKAELSDEERAQLGEAEQRYTAMQVEVRAARTLVEAEGEGETRDAAPGAEERERIELRSRCRVGNILAAALAGRGPTGPEAVFNPTWVSRLRIFRRNYGSARRGATLGRLVRLPRHLRRSA